jgi:c-di-GMP-binding flagellar brake protein YcgR
MVKCSKCGEIFRVFQPDGAEKRKFNRVKTRNLISYLSFDKTGKLISNGLGIALDVSKGGLLLETPYPIAKGLIVLAATDSENNLFEVKCKLIHSQKASTGTYLSGIEFIGIDERVKNFIMKLIKEYNYQGYNLFIAIAQKIHRLNPSPLRHKTPNIQ